MLGLGIGHWFGCVLRGRLLVVVRCCEAPERLLDPGRVSLLLSSSSDPSKAGVPRGGLLSPTVSVGGDGSKSESSGELRNHILCFNIFY